MNKCPICTSKLVLLRLNFKVEGYRYFKTCEYCVKTWELKKPDIFQKIIFYYFGSKRRFKGDYEK